MDQKQIIGKFDQYLKDIFSDYNDFFREWDVIKIQKDKRLWDSDKDYVYLCVIANWNTQKLHNAQQGHRKKKNSRCSGEAVDSYITCTKNIMSSIRKYNLQPPQSKRGTNADYRVIMYAILPPYRNFSSIPIKKSCKIGRGWPSKCKKLISLTHEMKLAWRVARCVIDSKSPYYNKTLDLGLSKLEIENIESYIIDKNTVKFPVLE